MPAITSALSTPVSPSPDQTFPVAASQPAAPVDTFENTATSSAVMPSQADIVDEVQMAIRGFKLEIEQKKKAHEAADAIVSCLTPLIARKGPLEDQVWMLLLRIMGKVQSENRDANIENARLERLQKAAKAEQAKLSADQKSRLDAPLAEIENVAKSLKNSQKSLSDDESRAIESLTALLRNQHESIMATLREIRGL